MRNTDIRIGSTVVKSLRTGRPGGSDVRVDRATRWGNPFRMSDQSRRERLRVIGLFEARLKAQAKDGKVGREELAALAGKSLWCWCAPQPCHAAALALAAECAAGSDQDWSDWLAS